MAMNEYFMISDKKCGYRADVHNFHKAMEKANVAFPCAKSEVISKLGNAKIQVDYSDAEEPFVEAASLVVPIKLDFFRNGAEFYNAFFAACVPNAVQF